MNTETTFGLEDQIESRIYRQLFFSHVGVVILSAAIVSILLLGITSIPSWISVASSLAIAAIAITFVVAAALTLWRKNQLSIQNRVQCLVLTLSLSMLQMIFLSPVFICIFAPTLRL